ncbi:hypothetical protein D3C71_1982550 [compost metagenome]
MQLANLGAHCHAQLGVQVGQRLVEQEDLRVAHDGSAHCDALALAAGELLGQPREQWLQPQDLGGSGHALFGLLLRRMAQLQREC